MAITQMTGDERVMITCIIVAGIVVIASLVASVSRDCECDCGQSTDEAAVVEVVEPDTLGGPCNSLWDRGWCSRSEYP